MAPKRKSVGAALDVLVAPHLGNTGEAGTLVPVSDLRPGRFQPRRHFAAAALKELAHSIKERGVLTPLLVRPTPRGLEIVAGERRWRAAKQAGLTEVPVVVRDLSDVEAEEIALLENLQREDLNVFEEVEATAALVARALGIEPSEVPGRIAALRRDPDEAQVERLVALFARLGRGSWTTFANRLRVLKLPGDVAEVLRRGELDYAVAVAIGRVKDDERRAELLRRAVDERLTFEAVTRLVEADNQPAKVDDTRRVLQLLGKKSTLKKLPADDRRRVDELVAELARLLDRGGS